MDHHHHQNNNYYASSKKRANLPMVVSVDMDGDNRRVRTAVRRTNLKDIVIDHDSTAVNKIEDEDESEYVPKPVQSSSTPTDVHYHPSSCVCTCPHHKKVVKQQQVTPGPMMMPLPQQQQRPEFLGVQVTPFAAKVIQIQNSIHHQPYPRSPFLYTPPQKRLRLEVTISNEEKIMEQQERHNLMDRLRRRLHRFSQKVGDIEKTTTKKLKLTSAPSLSSSMVTTTTTTTDPTTRQKKLADENDQNISLGQSILSTKNDLNKGSEVEGHKGPLTLPLRLEKGGEPTTVSLKIERASPPPSTTPSPEPDDSGSYFVPLASVKEEAVESSNEKEDVDDDEKICENELKLYEEQVKKLQSNLIALIHSILLTPKDQPIDQKLEAFQANFDLFHVAYSGSGRKDCLRLDGPFNISFLKHREPFTGRSDLRTVFERLHTHDKFQVLKRTATPAQFQLLWDRVKISMDRTASEPKTKKGATATAATATAAAPAAGVDKNVATSQKTLLNDNVPAQKLTTNVRNVIIKPIADCLEGTVFGSDGKIWTLSAGRWSTSRQNEVQMLRLHWWFVQFLNESWHQSGGNKEPEWRHFLKCRNDKFFIEDLNDNEKGGCSGGLRKIPPSIFPSNVVTPSQSLPNGTNNTMEGETRQSRRKPPYDFLEIEPDGRISIYFVCPNFSRSTAAIAHKIRVCAWKISNVDDAVETGSGYFSKFYRKQLEKKDDYFCTVFKTFTDFSRKVKQADLIYLHVTPGSSGGIGGRAKSFRREKETAITKVTVPVVRDWIVWEVPQMLNLTTAQREEWRASEKSSRKLSTLIFEELFDQKFLENSADDEDDEDGAEVTAKGLYVQRDQFHIHQPLLKVLGGQQEQEQAIIIEDAVFRLLQLYRTDFPVSVSKLDLRQAELYLRQLDEYGCELKLRVDEVSLCCCGGHLEVDDPVQNYSP